MKEKNIGYLRVRKGFNRSLTKEELKEAEKFHRKVSTPTWEDLKTRIW